MTTTRTAYARRDIKVDAYNRAIPTTFVSTDRADRDSLGWFTGHVEDGAEFRGYTLVHVMEPSWRCAAPMGLKRDAEAA